MTKSCPGGGGSRAIDEGARVEPESRPAHTSSIAGTDRFPAQRDVTMRIQGPRGLAGGWPALLLPSRPPPSPLQRSTSPQPPRGPGKLVLRLPVLGCLHGAGRHRNARGHCVRVALFCVRLCRVQELALQVTSVRFCTRQTYCSPCSTVGHVRSFLAGLRELRPQHLLVRHRSGSLRRTFLSLPAGLASWLYRQQHERSFPVVSRC